MIGFDQKTLLESISKHLDSIAELIKWAILFAIALWWAGVQKQNPIEALGIKVRREHAFALGAIAYSAVNVLVLLKLLRLGDLFRAIPDTSVSEGIARLTTHIWELNPFAYFGPDILARAHSGLGLGGLIVVWWMCNSSLFALGGNTGLAESILSGAFLSFGSASMLAIQRVDRIVLARTARLQPELYLIFSTLQKERTFFAFVGIIVGGTLAFVTNLLVSNI